MKTFTIGPAEFEVVFNNNFIIVKEDRLFPLNEVIEVSVQEESIHNLKHTTSLFKITDTMKYHPGIRNSYVVLSLKKYKVPFWTRLKFLFANIFRFFRALFNVKRPTSNGASISIRPIPNNRADNNFRHTQITRSRKGKIRNIKIKSKKI